jgi:hypothetical protein
MVKIMEAKQEDVQFEFSPEQQKEVEDYAAS